MSARHAFAAALALCLVASSVASSAHADVGAPPSVFIVGDSHVQMLGPTLGRRLEAAGVEVAGYEARPGWSTARYQRSGDLQDVLERAGRPEIVVVSLGGNDFVGSAETYYAQLAWVVDRARAAGAQQIVWLGPATSDEAAGARAAEVALRHEHNAELQAELLPALGVTWIDSRPMTEADHRRDGVHFTRAGYVRWAQGALPTVTELVAHHGATVGGDEEEELPAMA